MFYIVKRNLAITDPIYRGFQRVSEEEVKDYIKKHPNSEIIFFTAKHNEYIQKVLELKKDGIDVY